MTRDAIDDTLRRINLFRWMTGLEPVTHDASLHSRQQACAVLMDANGMLSHSPPSSWSCWTEDGAEGAGASNIALGYSTSAASIDGYIADRGVDSLGHRRWVLNGPLSRVSMGFVGRGGCLGVFDRSGTVTRSWTSWPSPGPVPLEIFQSGRTLEWWSVHSNDFNFSNATVQITDETGASLAIDQRVPAAGYGAHAIAFRPRGWSPTEGAIYRVRVTGAGPNTIDYTIQPARCP